MITIYQADSEIVRKSTTLRHLLDKLPENMHKRALRYKFEIDAFNFVIGRLLLEKSLSDLGVPLQIGEIKFHDSGKPFINNISFNISHTEGMVVCAITNQCEIGIDIEKVKPVTLSDFETWFTKSEWAEINNASSPLHKFYWYWTRKESIIKAMGVNLSYLHQIEIDPTRENFTENGRKWWLQDLDLTDDYSAALCSEKEALEVRTEKCIIQ